MATKTDNKRTYTKCLEWEAARREISWRHMHTWEQYHEMVHLVQQFDKTIANGVPMSDIDKMVAIEDDLYALTVCVVSELFEIDKLRAKVKKLQDRYGFMP